MSCLVIFYSFLTSILIASNKEWSAHIYFKLSLLSMTPITALLDEAADGVPSKHYQ